MKINDLKNAINSLNVIKTQSRFFNDLIVNLKHVDTSVNNYLDTLKKNSPKLLDVVNLIERNTGLVVNQLKNYEIREQQNQRIQKQKQKSKS